MRRVLSETDLRGFRERVCAAATELLAEAEHDGFNMRELAARLGVSAMTTYRYFESKNDIFAALRAQAFNKLAYRLERLLDLPGPSSDRFTVFCRGYVEFAREQPARYRLMFDHSQPEMARSAELGEAQRRMFQALVDQAGLLVAAGRTESSERTARNLWASLHGLAALALMEAIPEHALDGLIRDMIRRFAPPQERPAELKPEPWDSTTEPQPNWAGRANGVSLSGWMPITAAE
jgi:AcrR family transcriptional regulator